MRNTDRSVLVFGVLVAQPKCNRGSSLFYKLAHSSCSAELNTPVHHINWNHCLIQRKLINYCSLILSYICSGIAAYFEH